MNTKPWVSDSLIEFLEGYLKKDHDLFEWGSGGSTIFFSSRVKSVVSVENDASWYNSLKTQIPENVNLIFQEHDNEESDDVLNPSTYASNSLHFKYKVFRSYAKVINTFDLFDVIMIDGRSRIGCALEAKNHLKKDGILILDDWGRPYYNPVLDIYSGYQYKVVEGAKGKNVDSLVIFGK